MSSSLSVSAENLTNDPVSVDLLSKRFAVICLFLVRRPNHVFAISPGISG